jgi:hypothetical protein
VPPAPVPTPPRSVEWLDRFDPDFDLQPETNPPYGEVCARWVPPIRGPFISSVQRSSSISPRRRLTAYEDVRWRQHRLPSMMLWPATLGVVEAV